MLDAGAGVDEAAFEALLESSALGGVSASTIRQLATGKPEVDGVLGRYLLGARGRGLGYAAVADAVEALLAARVPKKRAVDDVGPVAAALALELPVADRVRLAERVVGAGYAKGPVSEALPELITQLEPDSLGPVLDVLKHEPGATFGPSARGLLHFAALAARELATDDPDTIDARIVPTFAALIARGESPSQADGKGKTPFDLAKPLRRELAAKDWERIEAALAGSAGTRPKKTAAMSFAAFPAAGFALGVAGALVAAKKLDEKVLATVWRSAAAEADDPGSEEAEKLAAEALAALPLTDAQLNAVKSLSFDFGEPIYARFEAATGTESGGESDVLEVSAIDGVSLLPKLERLDLTAYAGAVRTLAPLRGHPTLEELTIQSSPEDEATLLSLPALRRVACRHLSAATIDELRAAGVEVSDDLSRPAVPRATKTTRAAPKKAAPKKAKKR